MPRDGSNIYHRPFGTDGVPNTPVESAKYNIYIQDVEQDLNLPRPIVAGGTGATNASDALVALGGEVSNQIITNYNSDPIVPGSFYSATSATASPVSGHAFSGFAYGQTGNGLVLEARDLTDTNNPHTKYVRTYPPGGPWSIWTIDGRTIVGNNEGIGAITGDMFYGVNGVSPNSAFIVNTKADVSGINILTVAKAGQVTVNGLPGVANAFQLNKPAAGVGNQIQGATNGLLRWTEVLGNATAEGGSNAGSDYTLNRFNDAGAIIDSPLTISRATGAVSFTGSGTFGGALTVSGAVTFTSTLNVSGAITASSTIAGTNFFSSGGVVYLNNPTNSRYLQWDGTRYQLPGAPLGIGSPVAGTDAARVDWAQASFQPVNAQLFAGIPAQSVGNGYVTVATDAQKCMWLTGSITINSGLYPVGTCLTFIAWGGALTIANNAPGGMFWAGPSGPTSGSRTLAQYGIATALQFAGGYWLISGSGLT